MSNKKIFIDLDDTLLDTFRYLIKWHKRSTPYNCIENLAIYDLTCFVRADNGVTFTQSNISQLGMTHEECWGLLPQDFWNKIPIFYWAYELINLCEEMAGRKNVYILTKHIPTTDCVSGKVDWINKYLPQYSDRFIMCRNKYSIVDERSVLIDDSEENELEFLKNKRDKNFYLFPAFLNRRRSVFLDMTGYTSLHSGTYKEIIFNEIKKKFLEI